MVGLLGRAGRKLFVFPYPQGVAAVLGERMAHWAGIAGASGAEGTRSDDASCVVAAYVARRRFGNGASEAAALGYRSHGGGHNALLRVNAVGSLSGAIETICRTLANN